MVRYTDITYLYKGNNLL